MVFLDLLFSIVNVMASDHQIENNTSLDTFINALDEINNLNIHIKDNIDKIGVKYLNPKI